MYYFKKLIEGSYSYYASPKLPKDMEGMIVIPQEEYEKILEELFALAASDSEASQEKQD